jgi:hypothetical protein
MNTIGPNLLKLILRKVSADAIPAGCTNGLAAGVKFLSNKDAIRTAFRTAERWVRGAVQLVREAAEPNPWKNASDEEIAAELMKQFEARVTNGTALRLRENCCRQVDD